VAVGEEPALFYYYLREKRKIRQQNKKKKGKENKGSKKNVKSNLRIDGFENTDANL
jgi:hypothetical protein